MGGGLVGIMKRGAFETDHLQVAPSHRPVQASKPEVLHRNPD